MPIFNIQNQKLSLIKQKAINLEQDIQNLTEKNLNTVFELQFVSAQFALQRLRIDTLAFDKATNAFIIIEYKRDRSFSIIDQGFSYLALMLNNKAEFILEYNEKTKSNLRREDIDWSQSRVLFLAQSFTAHQQNAINFRDLPIELWEIKLFDNDTILYSQIISSETRESVKTITKNKDIESISKEIKVYSLEDHLEKGTEQSRGLFSLLQEKVSGFGDDIVEDPQKFYIAYKTGKNFVDIEIQRQNLKLWLNMKSGLLQDPRRIADDMTNPPRNHRGNGDYEIKFSNAEDLPYIVGLIEQSYQKSKA